MRSGVDFKGRKWEEELVSDRKKDFSGMKIGLLEVLFPVNTDFSKSIDNWLCLCDCGNFVVRSASTLGKKNNVCSCGCDRYYRARQTAMKKQKKNIGKKFGKLTVISVTDAPDHVNDNRFYYLCLCECGNFTTVRATDVKSGKVTSCGCAKKDAMSQRRNDLTGQTFGKLTVLYLSYIKKDTVYWHCVCECGRECDVRGSDLKNGHTSSCGCLLSLGELNISRILDDNKVDYLHDRGFFEDLVSDDGFSLRYDFIIFDKNKNPIRLIEFDGPQHSKPNYLFGEDEFEKTQYHDNLKNQYALSHNIPLVRIPYKKRKNVNFNDLFGDKYLI